MLDLFASLARWMENRTRHLPSCARLTLAVAVLLSGLGGTPTVAQTAADSARTLDSLTEHLTMQGDPSATRQSIADIRTALAIYHRQHDSTSIARMLDRLGKAYVYLTELDSAREYFQDALPVARAAGATGLEIKIVMHLANVAPERRQGVDLYHRAIVLMTAYEDSTDYAFAVYAIGSTYRMMSRGNSIKRFSDSAAVYLQEGWRLARAANDSTVLAKVHYEYGALHQAASRPDSALAHYRVALVLQDALDERYVKASTLFDIGNVYASLGRDELALVYLREAEGSFREFEQADSLGLLMVQMKKQAVEYRIVGQLLGVGKTDSALARFEAIGSGAENVRASIEKLVGEETILGSLDLIPDAFAFTGSLEDKPAFALLALARAQRDPRTIAEAMLGVAREHAASDQLERSVAYYDSALTLYRASTDLFGEAQTLVELGQLYHRRPAMMDLERATGYYRGAAEVRRRLGRFVSDDVDRVSFVEQTVDLVSAWALAEMGRPRAAAETNSVLDALAVVERGRTPVLRQLIGQYADLAELSGPDVAIEDLVAASGETGTPRIVYHLAEDTMLIWLVSPQNHVRLFRQPLLTRSVQAAYATMSTEMQTMGRRTVGRDSLSRIVGGFRAEVDGPPPEGQAAGDYAKALRELLLPAELLADLPSGGELAIVPFGPLGLVPFAALTLPDGEPVGARYAVRYAPSLALLAHLDRVPLVGIRDADTFLIVGNPRIGTVRDVLTGGVFVLRRLAGAESTAVWLGDELRTPIMVAETATEAAVRERVGGAALIHFGAHGYAYAGAELAGESFIAVTAGDASDDADETNDGRITADEILTEFPALNADLAVLSACVTGLGDLREAEGVVGLARALLAKGTRTVIASLWDVDDAVTAMFMRRFYTALLGDQSITNAEALQKAQDHVRQFHPHPYYWAAFQVIGGQ